MAKPLVDEAIDQDPHPPPRGFRAVLPCRAAVVCPDPPSATPPGSSAVTARRSGRAGASSTPDGRPCWYWPTCAKTRPSPSWPRASAAAPRPPGATSARPWAARRHRQDRVVHPRDREAPGASRPSGRQAAAFADQHARPLRGMANPWLTDPGSGPGTHSGRTGRRFKPGARRQTSHSLVGRRHRLGHRVGALATSAERP
jgi:hypothetical protein